MQKLFIFHLVDTKLELDEELTQMLTKRTKNLN